MEENRSKKTKVGRKKNKMNTIYTQQWLANFPGKDMARNTEF